ncbi:MAG: phage head morphogenesis protein, partial [Caulobacteraceae bacterium]
AAMRKLGRRWQRRIDALAPKLAAHFASASQRLTDEQMKAELRKAGMTVRFKASAAQNDAYQAVIGEQVALITNLPEQYMAQVEGIVMRAVQTGGDRHAIAKSLEEQAGVTKRRAARIARDQTNKATAVFTRVRQEELGVTEAIWRHSGGGKTPRPSHVAFSGQRYNIREGAVLDGERVWPGTAINCRCVSQAILPFLE